MAKKYFYTILRLTLFVAGSFFFTQPALCQSTGIRPDGTTPTAITGGLSCITDCTISGGSRLGNNLFHSFNQFNILENVTVTFEDDNASNIFARVTDTASIINGTLAVTGNSRASFFLLNPQGIIFGPQASLSIPGSFIASTADALIFSDGSRFSAEKNNIPLLTVSAPIGFQFGRDPGAIINRSQSGELGPLGEPVGLSVQGGETLSLLGNGVFLEGGHLTVNNGQVTIGSVAANSSVALAPDFTLAYDNVRDFSDIVLSQEALIDTSGLEGNITLHGRNITLLDKAFIANLPMGNASTRNIQLFAEETIDIAGAGVIISPSFRDNSNGADLTISANRFLLREGAFLSGDTTGTGNGGTITINAADSIEISGVGSINVNGVESFIPSLVTTSTALGTGSGGNINLNTRRLTVRDGAQINAVTYGAGKGGDVIINASDSVDVLGGLRAGQSAVINSGIFASSEIADSFEQSTGAGGSVVINTAVLSVRDGAQVAVNSLGQGDAGDLRVSARAVELRNQAQLTAAANFGNGGNLLLSNLDTLILRQGSAISTRAGVGDGQGNGGNISIDADFIVTALLEDSDITAKASRGRGGNIDITTRGLYGIEERRAIAHNGTNDIDASSELGISGTTRIEQPLAEADTSGVLEVHQPIELSAAINQSCNTIGNRFVFTGRGGLPTQPSSLWEASVPLMDLGINNPQTLQQIPQQISRQISQQAIQQDNYLTRQTDSLGDRSSDRLSNSQSLSAPLNRWATPLPTPIEANSWRTDENNQVVLTVQTEKNSNFPETNIGHCTG
jgi:filamentous hemagglutinin family protein